MTLSSIHKPRRVKARFLSTVAVALILVMCVFALALYFVERNIRKIDLAERSGAVIKLFEQKLAKDANLMQAVLRAMTANQAIEDAFVKGSRPALAKQTGALFDTLRKEHRLTHLYFHTPELMNLYRVHSPDHFGDQITRVTSLQAKAMGAPVSGLELGRLGTLTLRTVMPWKSNGKVLGYVEIGEEIEYLIDEISQSLNVDLLVLVEKRGLDPAQWQQGLAMMKREGSWERYRDHVALAQTDATHIAALDRMALDQLITGQNNIVEHQGKTLHLAMMPLTDVSHQHIGELVVMHDITAMQSTFRWSVTAVTLASILVAIGVLGIFYVALGQVERDYQRQHELELQILRLNTDHQRILQMEKLSTLGTMVGGIAHQLNNPLVGVVNMAQLAAREIGNPAQTQNLLNEIRQAGEDCRLFVRRMLEFSKVSSFISKPTLMAPLIEETVMMFRQAENRRHPVELTLPQEAVVLNVDPILLRHALFNLLQNAAQAVTGDSPIVISLEAEADAERNTRGWTLAVINQGPSIPPDVMQRIFEPFFTTRSDGTGLGLPVVQHVALVHGGQVSVRSEAALGTRFAIWLPVLPMVPA